MERARLDLALSYLKPGGWELFENLASAFAVDEHGDLRTVADPAGDGGRDAFLFQPIEDEQILLQYSVAADWDSKVRATAKKVSKNFAGTKILIYVTNQAIGSKANDLRKEIRKSYKLHLDVYDRAWFLDRVDRSIAVEAAAESVAHAVLDPILSEGGLLERRAAPLSSMEAQAALVHLELQVADDIKAKGLTKVCFEALVRTVMRDTHVEHRMPRASIQAAVRALVPVQDAAQVDVYTDSALQRLTKKYIRHHRKPDEFCLMHAERIRLEQRLVDLASRDEQLNDELLAATIRAADLLGVAVEAPGLLAERVRRVLERVLLVRGEHFVASVVAGEPYVMTADDIEAAVTEDVRSKPWPAELGGQHVSVVVEAVGTVLASPGTSVQEHLRSMADAYTLFAFLRETPDVQGAVVKLFSHGELWLDTTILLPLIAEDLLEPADRRLGLLIAAVREAGLKLYVTHGAIDEVLGHLHRAVIYPRNKHEWKSSVPFIYTAFALSGRVVSDLPRWLENFRGTARPADDIAAFLRDEHGVEVRDLKKEAESAKADLSSWAEKMWRSAHKGRRPGNGGGDDGRTEQLIDHDIETYLGVLQRRQAEKDGPYGFTAWLLTFDTAALKTRPPKGIASPAMSPDFLTNYLSLAPIRRRLRAETSNMLPIISGVAELEVLPDELLDEAERIREECRDLPQRVIERRVRDHLDRARRRHGDLAKAGSKGVEDGILKKLERAGRRPPKRDPAAARTMTSASGFASPKNP